MCIIRPNHILRKPHILNDNQYDFTPQSSTEDALVSLCDTVQQVKLKKLVTFLTSFDIRRALDNAWWPGILQLVKGSRCSIEVGRTWHVIFNPTDDEFHKFKQLYFFVERQLFVKYST